jgi:hypothetical protein
MVTTYNMRRTNTRTWALLACRGGRSTLIGETTTQGSRRARIEFEREHRIVIDTVETEADRRNAEATASDLALTALD